MIASRRLVAGVDIGVVVPGHQIEKGRYALGVAARTLAYFNDYFGVKYPLPKLDNILVPRNFDRRDGELGRRHLFRTRAAVR